MRRRCPPSTRTPTCPTPVRTREPSLISWTSSARCVRAPFGSSPPSPKRRGLRPATPADVPTILRCIRGLAEYDRLAHQCVATEELLTESLFGATAAAEVVLAFDGSEPAGFALWFRSYSTFPARPGIYLEDLF